ncbi:MAG: class I SAM-dependent methyltransferase [Planctomycetes bacterium]|nr:class I SAM-dependent methyltransferase [Planctomycetota bacterium]
MSAVVTPAHTHLSSTRSRVVLDGDRVELHDDTGGVTSHPIGSPEAFRVISDYWLRSGWDTKYVYSFSYLGRPIIQLPEDMIRMQEVIFSVEPDVLVETGVAHGGSLIFYSSLFRAMGKGRVVGVDIEIRPHNRAAIEAHELFDRITLIEGSSTDPDIVSQVKGQIASGERAMVILDSNHTRDHVRAELEAYADIVSVGSYLVACDGIMEGLVGAPRSNDDWEWNNPRTAAAEFVEADERFELVEPTFPFNEGQVTDRVTYCPGAFVKRVR